MFNEKDVKRKLKEIRYYYARRKSMEMASEDVGENDIVKLIQKYNGIIKEASPRLYDLYVSLYVKNNTQISMAETMGYTRNYINQLNKDLVLFIVKKLNEGEKENESNA